MERILSLAIIGVALISGYVITSGTNAPRAVAQGGALNSAPVSDVKLAKLTPPAQIDGGRPSGHVSYVQNCQRDAKKARSANPEYKYQTNHTVEVLCECLLDSMVSEGITEREVGIIADENLVFAQAYSMDDPQEAMNKMIASEKRMNTKLGKDRYSAIKLKTMKAMRCPGLLPTNLKEVIGR